MNLHFSFESRIKPVFNVVVGSTGYKLCDFRPLIAVLSVGLDNGSVFFLSPLVLLDIRVQVVVPPFSTLLSNPSWKCLGYIAPVFSSKFLHIFRQFSIFKTAPRPFDHERIKNLLPPVKALYVSPMR